MKIWAVKYYSYITIYKHKKPTIHNSEVFLPDLPLYSTVMTERQMRVLETMKSQKHLKGISLWMLSEHEWMECLVPMARFLKHLKVLEVRFNHETLKGDRGMSDWFHGLCMVELDPDNFFYISFPSCIIENQNKRQKTS